MCWRASAALSWAGSESRDGDVNSEEAVEASEPTITLACVWKSGSGEVVVGEDARAARASALFLRIVYFLLLSFRLFVPGSTSDSAFTGDGRLSGATDAWAPPGPS